jgi:hypothetical protein
VSWDILIQAADSPPPKFADLSPDWEGTPLGSLDFVRSTLNKVVPNSIWQDGNFGLYETDEGSIEYNLGDEEPCTAIMLHVRGHGEPLIAQLIAIANVSGWYALDILQGEWFHHGADPRVGLSDFHKFQEASLLEISPEPTKPFWRRWLGFS